MNKNKLVRNIILYFFLVLFTIFSIRHFILGGRVAASIDAMCPFGGFETLFTYISTGGFVPKILMSGFVLAIGILVTTLILGRGFCGYICPFGAIQELLSKLNKNSKNEINQKIDKYGKAIKYVLLILILVGTYLTTNLVFTYIDPFKTFFHFGKGVFWGLEENIWLSVFTFIFTLIILLASYYINRFWCRYLCPLGATMNIFNSFRRTKIHKTTRGKNKCIKCGICDKKCPMQVNPSKDKFVKSLDCINCNKCINVCPKNSLSIKTFNKKISPITYAILIVVLFFGIVFASKIIGVWQSVPGTSISQGSSFNPDLIKGWMTITDVANEIGLEPEQLKHNLGLPCDAPLDVSFRDLKEVIPGFETEIVREYVANLETNMKNVEIDCPWGIENETSPRCGLWDDRDQNGICDLSE